MNFSKPSCCQETFCLCAAGVVLSLAFFILPVQAATILRLPALCELSLEELLKVRAITNGSALSESP